MRIHQTFVFFQTFLALMFLVGWAQVRAQDEEEEEDEEPYPAHHGPYPGGIDFPPHHGGPGYHPPYSYSDLDQLEQFIHTVTMERDQVSKRVQMLKMQKQNLLDKLDWIKVDVIPQFYRDQRLQDTDLDAINDKIKLMLHSIGDNENLLAGQRRVTDLQEASVNPRWEALIEQVEFNNRQQAVLERTRTFLEEAAEKLHKKLNASETEGEAKVVELKFNTEAKGDLLNSRYCFKGSAAVDVHANMTGTTVVNFEEDMILRQTPTSFCGMQGFVAHLNPDRSQHYGYPEQYQNIAVTVDCKPFSNKLEVTVFDNSKGQYNEIERAYVQYKLCTMGPQASE